MSVVCIELGLTLLENHAGLFFPVEVQDQITEIHIFPDKYNTILAQKRNPNVEEDVVHHNQIRQQNSPLEPKGSLHMNQHV
jgi:hypothetical protein